MTDENGQKNAREEAARGAEALAAARILLAGGFFNDAVSRAYYAAFHWARALLVCRGIEPRTHRGVSQMLGLHFLKTGILSEKAGSDFAHLQTYRELSDYNSSARFTKKQAMQEVARARRFIAACRPLLRRR